MKKKELKNKVLNKLIFLLQVKKEAGIGLVELLVVAIILGIMAVVAAPQIISIRDPSTDAYNQTKALARQIRQRAIATTSAMRMRVDPDDNSKFVVEVVNSRGCQAVTKLRNDASAGEYEISVYSVRGFQVGDLIDVGDSQDHQILAIPDENTFQIESTGLTSSQLKDAPVKLAVNWRKDNSLQESGLTLPRNVTIASNISGWSLCFNSRGLATIFNGIGESQPELELTLENSSNDSEKIITILQGGAIDTTTN